MKYLRRFEDVYYEPEKSVGKWLVRMEKLMEEFVSNFVDEEIGTDICDFNIDVNTNRILISVSYNKEERYKGEYGEEIKKEWKQTMDYMIEKLKKEFDYDFEPHNLSENGFTITVNTKE